MKLSFLAITTLATVALAQDNSTNPANPTMECPTCLQTQLQSSTGCVGVNITLQFLDPNENPGIAKCLCANMDGAFMDPCKAETICGADIEAFKSSFKSNLEQVGLRCNGSSPTFVPPPPDPVAPSSTNAGGAKPTERPPSASSQLLTSSMAAGFVALVVGTAVQFL
ncbi:hypothetical protein DFQ26_004278 [Actinomortierella ambigua]|nr:hypothetical protein DFQ26_004278 [Actinomortierella ambigua]